MSENHHGHGDISRDLTKRRLLISIALNVSITVAEVIGGILSNSLSLLSDAIHNLNDAVSLFISLIAYRISKKPPDLTKTFGYKRAEIISAFVNLIILVIISLYLIKTGIERFFHPEPIDGFVMFSVAVIGLVGNVFAATLLYRSSRENLNIRSAFYHVFSDALSSIAVIISSILILTYQYYIFDTILTLSIAGYIMYVSFHMLNKVVNILMESVPKDIDVVRLMNDVKDVNGVTSIHHVHVWRLDEKLTCLEAHIVIEKEYLRHMEGIKKELQQLMNTRYNINHPTFEIETKECTDR